MEMMQKPRIDRPEHYFRVGMERMEQAWILFDEKEGNSYALAMYVAGVAVESMLRAFKASKDPGSSFDERHNLDLLYKASGMLVSESLLQEKGLSEEKAKHHFRELQAAHGDICRLWANEFRFASEERLRAHLKHMKLDRKIQGDFLKKRAKDLLVAAKKFIDRGVFQWRLLIDSRTS